MEFIIGLIAVVAIAALIYFNRSAKSLDVNNDGKVDLADAKTAVDNAVAGVTTAIEQSQTTVKKAAVRAKAAAKKPAAKKPARSKK